MLSGEDVFEGSKWRSLTTKFESLMAKFWWQSSRVQQWSLTMKFRGFLALLVKFDSQSTLFSKFNSLLVPVVNIGEVYTPFSKSKSHLRSSLAKFQSSSKSISIFVHFQSSMRSSTAFKVAAFLFDDHKPGSMNISRAVMTLSRH